VLGLFFPSNSSQSARNSGCVIRREILLCQRGTLGSWAHIKCSEHLLDLAKDYRGGKERKLGVRVNDIFIIICLFSNHYSDVGHLGQV